MPNDCEEIRYRAVRKRKRGKYVTEIRSRKRSRISLGSYFTPHAAARAYDAALLCLRGPNATAFNFPVTQINPGVLEVASAETNRSPETIRTAAIAIGSAYDVVPPADDDEAGRKVEEAVPTESSTETRDAPKDTSHQVEGEEEEEEEEENDIKYLLQSPEHIPFEESVQMAPLQPDLQPYDQSEIFHDLDSWDAVPKPPE
ncbi:hypothetical protein SUGI_0298300 [Cryptomeria japonica]|uniref:ethylene-responsive transcription factor ERF013-like n=1 Tax=Cryptomeria japonica TaxID=3369 RepID=UPI002408E18A|nr:ethylene-responsive transcription factor ERF013-like [Cryptomeria japonica]GLJ17218.1 hypothetical protein SUGI_0298300 [Cryptomeria japonica]